MDASACNYDALVTTDAGSCDYAPVGQDCDGNCLAGTLLSYVPSSPGYPLYPEEDSFTINDCAGTMVAEMSSGVDGFNSCVVLPDIAVLTLTDSFGDGWRTALDIGSGSDVVTLTLTTGTAPGTTSTSQAYVLVNGAVSADAYCEYPGCTDVKACNYDADANVNSDCEYTGSDSNGELGCLGCKDMNAGNYDPAATVDSGICVYTQCSADKTFVHYVHPRVKQSGAPGFPEEDSFTITDCDGTLIAGMSSGLDGFNECVPLPDIAVLTLTDSFGDGWNVGKLHIGEKGGNEYGYGDAFTAFGLGEGFEVGVTHTADATGACDCDGHVFDECAVCGGGSTCLGCTDVAACNYDADATIDSGCLYTTCLGCTDVAACNYDADATIDSGNCILRSVHYTMCPHAACAHCDVRCNDAPKWINAGCCTC